MNTDKLDKMTTDELVSVFYHTEFLLNRRNLLPIKNGKNVIKIYKDDSCAMATVYFNKEHMMTGNYHDFHPGCHGGLLSVIGTLTNRGFFNCSTMADMLSNYVMKLSNTVGANRNGDNVTVVIEQYSGKWSHGARPWKSLVHTHTDGIKALKSTMAL